jgi:hypothetical protein
MIAPLILTDDNALLAQCQQEELDAISVLRLEIR